ncbi:MAG: SH3 domain-containing protein [Rhodospirillales bacterium]
MNFMPVRHHAAPFLAGLSLAVALCAPPALADPKFPPPAKPAAVTADTHSTLNPNTRDAIIKRGSGLPVPRFASMRSDDVNVRSGPGTRYPVEWVFQRKNMPVEVVGEFDTWRKIRDWQGTTGWVHQSMLVGKRMVVVAGKQVSLLRTPENDSAPVARIEASVQGELLSCKGGWCRVRVNDYKGWLTRKDIWGVYADEKIE